MDSSMFINKNIKKLEKDKIDKKLASDARKIAKFKFDDLSTEDVWEKVQSSINDSCEEK